MLTFTRTSRIEIATSMDQTEGQRLHQLLSKLARHAEQLRDQNLGDRDLAEDARAARSLATNLSRALDAPIINLPTPTTELEPL